MATFTSSFSRSELVGRFRWDSEFTNALKPTGDSFFHATHRKFMKRFHRTDELWLRSHFDVKTKTGLQTFECVWTSLQAWHQTHRHNHFGPFTIKLPKSALEGRRFYVFKRMLNGWLHYYFVQRESNKMLFSRYPAERCNPDDFFLQTNDGLDFKTFTQYEVVLTEPVDLNGATILATHHRTCASRRKCDEMSKVQGIDAIQGLFESDVRKLLKRFPQARNHVAAF